MSNKLTDNEAGVLTEQQAPTTMILRRFAHHAAVQPPKRRFSTAVYIRVFAPRPLWLPTTIRRRVLLQKTTSSQLFKNRFNPSAKQYSKTYIPLRTTMMNRMSSQWTLMNLFFARSV